MYKIETKAGLTIGAIVFRKDYNGWVGCTAHAGNDFAPKNASAYESEATAKRAIERRGYVVVKAEDKL